jgi:hypothetical protein
LKYFATFFTRSVELIFSILLQHHISKLSRYLSSAFRSDQVLGPYKPTLQMWHSTIRTVQITALLIVLLSVIISFDKPSVKTINIIGNFHLFLLAQNKFHLLILFLSPVKTSPVSDGWRL